MSHVMKLTLAVILALAAAMLNVMWLKAQVRPSTYVAAGKDVKPGQEITADMLTSVPVPGNADTLRAALIPYAKRAILLGTKTSRGYTRGDIIFQRDLRAPVEIAEFDVIGPFQVIKSATGRDEQVTIAVNGDFDEQTRRLMQMIDPNRKSTRDATVAKIVSINVVPKERVASLPALAAKNTVLLAVSLSGIENVPSDLKEGDYIQFVVPVISSI